MAHHFQIIEWINESWYPDMIKQLQRVVAETTESEIEKGKVSYGQSSDEIPRKFITVNKNVEVLPDVYKCDNPKVEPYIRNDFRVLDYRPEEKFNMLIDHKFDNWTPLRVNQCHFEIHLDKENKILEVFVPL